MEAEKIILEESLGDRMGGRGQGGDGIGEGREGKILNSALGSWRMHGARLFAEGWRRVRVC